MIKFEDALDVVLLLAVIGVVEDWAIPEVASSVVVVVTIVVEDWDPLEVAVAVVSTVVGWDLFKVLVVCVVVLISAVVLSGPGYARIWSLAKFTLFEISIETSESVQAWTTLSHGEVEFGEDWLSILLLNIFNLKAVSGHTWFWIREIFWGCSSSGWCCGWLRHFRSACSLCGGPDDRCCSIWFCLQTGMINSAVCFFTVSLNWTKQHLKVSIP